MISVRAKFGAPLSKREKQVCALVAEGLSNSEIGRDLHVTEETIKTFLQLIMAKLGEPSRAAVAVHWLSLQESSLAAQAAVEMAAVRAAEKKVAAAAQQGHLTPETWSPRVMYGYLKCCEVARGDVTAVPDALIAHFGPESRLPIRMMCEGLEALGLIRYRAGRLTILRVPDYAGACSRAARKGRDVSDVLGALDALITDLRRFQNLGAA